MKSMNKRNAKKQAEKSNKIKEVQLNSKDQQKMSDMEQLSKCWDTKCKVVKILDLLNKGWYLRSDK